MPDKERAAERNEKLRIVPADAYTNMLAFLNGMAAANYAPIERAYNGVGMLMRLVRKDAVGLKEGKKKRG